jgi:hypothetical protein
MITDVLQACIQFMLTHRTLVCKGNINWNLIKVCIIHPHVVVSFTALVFRMKCLRLRIRCKSEIVSCIGSDLVSNQVTYRLLSLKCVT